jgi:hypothetical protein
MIVTFATVGSLAAVDAPRLFLSPIVVGGGTRALPEDVRLRLELRGVRRFENGTVFLHYRIA